MSTVLSAIVRKARQVTGDPVLRRWLVGRALGRRPAEPPFTAHCPPYLDGLLPLTPEIPAPSRPFTAPVAAMVAESPAAPLSLPLPGGDETIVPGGEGGLFDKEYADTERLLAVYRFAWLPLLGGDVDPAWVDALWRAWAARFATPDGGWPWHPYTAAERAINLLAFARRHGLPGDAEATLSLLAAHAPAIAERLEYFGEHHTSNHMANDGRGLLVLGLELGLAKAADMGARILVEEARRIFRPSGILREGSSHYHLLLARNYAHAAGMAEAYGHPAAAELRAVADRALAVAPAFVLPGGLPLVGDVSPDIPPAALLAEMGLEGGGTLAEDGWLRFETGPWSGLWHADPGGWSHMPGHGHQDTGSFELHFEDVALFVDPGRGAYGEEGEAALYRSSAVHNGLTVDGADPYPPNKPYYDDRFRASVGGPPPALSVEDDGVFLAFDGYARLPGVGTARRRWRFKGSRMTVSDRVEGRGIHRLTRRLVTPLAVTLEGGAAILKDGGRTFRVEADGGIVVRPVTRWRAYGSGETATLLEISVDMGLPHDLTLTVEAL